jgi:hypothetical protein
MLNLINGGWLMTDLQEIYSEWQNNEEFKKALKTDPHAALKKWKFEVSEEDYKKIEAMLKFDKSKNEKLDDRISK